MVMVPVLVPQALEVAGGHVAVAAPLPMVTRFAILQKLSVILCGDRMHAGWYVGKPVSRGKGSAIKTENIILPPPLGSPFFILPPPPQGSALRTTNVTSVGGVPVPTLVIVTFCDAVQLLASLTVMVCTPTVAVDEEYGRLACAAIQTVIAAVLCLLNHWLYHTIEHRRLPGIKWWWLIQAWRSRNRNLFGNKIAGIPCIQCICTRATLVKILLLVYRAVNGIL